jgi:hypothetical protein
MRRAAALSVYALAAACWLAGGPGGVTLDALLACRHHQAHHTHAGHTGTPPDGPCFCSEMTGASDQAISPAVPASPPEQPGLATAPHLATPSSPVSLPPSPSFAPESPPPNALA